MSDAPVTSAVPANDALTQTIKAALDPAAIRDALIAETESQIRAQAAAPAVAAEKAAADQVAADKAAADAAAAAVAPAEGFKRTETIGGKEFTFEAGSELEIERMVTNAYKVAYAVQQPTKTADPAKEAADKVAADQAAVERAAVNADLELQFKRGEITASAYLEKTGAINDYLKDYLEKQGVPLDELRASVEEKRSKGFTQSWESATQEFLTGAGNQDWPGGAKNLEIIGLKLAAMGLVDAEDKVAALAQAWTSMKASGAYFPAEAPAAAPAAPVAVPAGVPAVVPAAAAVPARTAPTSSSFFGASSGPGGVGSAERAVAEAKVDIPKDATPAEIIAAWRDAQIKQGKDPNTAFTETFSSHRS